MSWKNVEAFWTEWTGFAAGSNESMLIHAHDHGGLMEALTHLIIAGRKESKRLIADSINKAISLMEKTGTLPEFASPVSDFSTRKQDEMYVLAYKLAKDIMHRLGDSEEKFITCLLRSGSNLYVLHGVLHKDGPHPHCDSETASRILRNKKDRAMEFGASLIPVDEAAVWLVQV